MRLEIQYGDLTLVSEDVFEVEFAHGAEGEIALSAKGEPAESPQRLVRY